MKIEKTQETKRLKIIVGKEYLCGERTIKVLHYEPHKTSGGIGFHDARYIGTLMHLGKLSPSLGLFGEDGHPDCNNIKTLKHQLRQLRRDRDDQE